MAGRGRSPSFGAADDVVIYIKGSKTDQYSFGCRRNRYQTGNDFCPAKALAELERLAPQRWTSESDLPLFRDEEGEAHRKAFEGRTSWTSWARRHRPWERTPPASGVAP